MGEAEVQKALFKLVRHPGCRGIPHAGDRALALNEYGHRPKHGGRGRDLAPMRTSCASSASTWQGYAERVQGRGSS